MGEKKQCRGRRERREREENRTTKREAWRKRKETGRLGKKAARERGDRKRNREMGEREGDGKIGVLSPPTVLVMKSRSLMFLCSEANEALFSPLPQGMEIKVNAVVCQE